MALKLTKIITVYGKELVFVNAYIKVGNIEGNKNTIVASVDYLDKENGILFLRSDFIVSHNMDGKNAIAQAYEHLKTLPEFEGAQDC